MKTAMPYIKTSTVQIAYHTDGYYPSTPLVLLHGFCEDHSVWTPWLAHLPDVPIIRIDLPGFGGTSLPPTTDMRHYAKAVLDVLDEQSVEQCVLHGHSMGGYAALEFAERWPERLVGLGLFHSHPYADKPATRDNRLRGIEMLHAGKRDLYVTQLFAGLFTPEFAQAHPEIIQTAKEQSAEAIITALEVMLSRRDHSTTLRHLTVPVQIIQGEMDNVVPLESALSAAKLPKTVDLQVLPEVAHMGMFEAPDRTAGMVQSFWADCLERVSA